MIAVVFPGQGSQKPGMGKELFEAEQTARDVFRIVSDATKQDLEMLCFETDEETLRQTQNAQLALFTTGMAAFSVLKAHRPNLPISAAAGHSVGEYAAIACAGLLPIERVAQLVQFRGLLMAEAGKEKPGAMAAVLGMERDDLEAVCTETDGIVVIANDNCPGQLVISGEVDAVGQAGILAGERGAKRVLPLNVSGAFHSPLMAEAAKRMATALTGLECSTTSDFPIYANVTAEPMTDAERWPRLLEQQLSSPVRWTESVQNMIRDGVDVFIECGAGEVLSSLIRRINKEVRTLKVGETDSLVATLAAL
jgi:[acyl-carrier-protein] S-malonyltransferase